MDYNTKLDVHLVENNEIGEILKLLKLFILKDRIIVIKTSLASLKLAVKNNKNVDFRETQ